MDITDGENGSIIIEFTVLPLALEYINVTVSSRINGYASSMEQMQINASQWYHALDIISILAKKSHTNWMKEGF
jgi:hypothetical protein